MYVNRDEKHQKPHGETEIYCVTRTPQNAHLIDECLESNWLAPMVTPDDMMDFYREIRKQELERDSQ